jgi:hypothetical protein
MTLRRDLLVANLAASLLLLIVLLIGWWEAAAFGLAVLAILDLLVVLRGRQAHYDENRAEEQDSASAHERGDNMGDEWPEFRYEQARVAYEAGQKLYQGDQVYLVRPALREAAEGLVLWVTDERTLGEHGLLLFPDGRTEVK